jgi:hypothetical protein
MLSGPPYSLAPAEFRFPALAALAGRAQLGGKREVALASLMAARLVAGLLPPWPVRGESRSLRGAGARTWFGSLALPAAGGLRVAFARLVETTAGDDLEALGVALAKVIEVTAPHLDARALSELKQLARAVAE